MIFWEFQGARERFEGIRRSASDFFITILGGRLHFYKQETPYRRPSGMISRMKLKNCRVHDVNTRYKRGAVREGRTKQAIILPAVASRSFSVTSKKFAIETVDRLQTGEKLSRFRFHLGSSSRTQSWLLSRDSCINNDIFFSIAPGHLYNIFLARRNSRYAKGRVRVLGPWKLADQIRSSTT